ncbi:LPS export ABC transporter permease LptF [Agaricicola taiwanensis]|uniref:LPS export ABC transporter permease LptF n=1 Tax=Agaricicola taiwanensis TaxID=591372 RepID=A0A8J2YJG2_9RHOB|nr:LPS export ABC transporter permease LptF [Agaricicola taiwanensis]GGE46840.1 LPS export ABC transporter permease LptF [Agaricicola taiwanensis]
MIPVLDRYLFRQATLAFLGSLLVLTGVVWITQALREFDVVTAQGQTLWTFFLVTGLALPSLALVVAPVALFGAIIFVLNRLNADSELPIMSSAGVTPWRLMRPLLVLAVMVAVLVGTLSTSAIPASLRQLRDIITQIRADVVVNILREGSFTSMGDGLTVHIRQRTQNNTLLGIFVEDKRDPNQIITYVAERGRVLENDAGTFLVLEQGSLQRKEAQSLDIPMVVFERYAFDLSPLADDGDSVITYKPRERYTAELLMPDPSDELYKAVPGRFRSELHERLASPLYPVAFMFIAFAILGRARTTRQSRATSVLAAITIAFVVRLIGYGATSLAGSSAAAVPLVYLVPIAAVVGSIFVILGGPRRLRLSWRSRRAQEGYA